jgi:hypothetical protein
MLGVRRLGVRRKLACLQRLILNCTLNKRFPLSPNLQFMLRILWQTFLRVLQGLQGLQRKALPSVKKCDC